MPTYRFRLRFHVPNKGLLIGDGQKYELVLPNGHGATLVCIEADNLREATRFVIISGGYLTEEEAYTEGQAVKEAVLCYGTKHRVGVDTGNDKATSFFGKVVKDAILEEHGVRVIDDVHGVCVYDEEHPATSGSMSGAFLINAREADFFAAEICSILAAPKDIAPKTRLAMELLAASHFESSPRSRFLTLVLATEALIEPIDRPDEVKMLVNDLIERTAASNLSAEEKQSILGSLSWLNKNSLSKSLKLMAETHLPGKEYDSLTASRFIAKCYEARSKLVHTGSADESKYPIGSLAANLEVYVCDMLRDIIGF